MADGCEAPTTISDPGRGAFRWNRPVSSRFDEATRDRKFAVVFRPIAKAGRKTDTFKWFSWFKGDAC